MRERRMRPGRAGAVLAVSALLLGGSSIAVPVLPSGVAAGDDAAWRLVFRDEFEVGVLDPQRWTTCYWWATDGCNIGTSGEVEWYQPGNVTVDRGVLRLTARRQPIVNDDGERFAYTSGMVSTGRATPDRGVPPLFAFTYGLAEVRARLPAGAGLWPAFWLLALDHQSRPEIDVMEVLGNDITTLRVHYHSVVDGERVSGGERIAASDLSAGWHTYAVDWSPQRIVWYLDGVAKWWVEDPSVISNEPMYLILNLAVGGDFAGAPTAATMFPSSYLIEYVRVWQRAGA